MLQKAVCLVKVTVPLSSMDLSNRDIRAMILCDLFGGKSYEERLARLTVCFWGRSPAKSTVTKWYRQCHFGQQALENERCYGCPVVTVTAENKAKSLIKEDTRITHD